MSTFLAVNEGREHDRNLVAVGEALNSLAIGNFIESKYGGSLVPAF